MSDVRRLVTFADVDDRASDLRKMRVVLLHEAELTDGRRVILLDDRGWGGSGTWAQSSVEVIREASRVVVGPDAAPPGQSEEDMADLHWLTLEGTARRQGVAVSAGELRRLPHDVVLSERLLARVGHAKE